MAVDVSKELIRIAKRAPQVNVIAEVDLMTLEVRLRRTRPP